MAERVGIEPTVELPRQQFSRLPDSATLAPLRRPDCLCVNREQARGNRSTTLAEAYRVEGRYCNGQTLFH